MYLLRIFKNEISVRGIDGLPNQVTETVVVARCAQFQTRSQVAFKHGFVGTDALGAQPGIPFLLARKRVIELV